MVHITDSHECQAGFHEDCVVARPVPPGVMGGWKCGCKCHEPKKPSARIVAMTVEQLMAKLMTKLYFSSDPQNHFTVGMVQLTFSIPEEQAQELLDRAVELGWMHSFPAKYSSDRY